MSKRRDVDSTTDLGIAPLGMASAVGRCNYQWAVEGPRGAVIFYCTNDNIRERCDGAPHRVRFETATDRVKLEWRNTDDLVARSKAKEPK